MKKTLIPALLVLITGIALAVTFLKEDKKPMHVLQFPIGNNYNKEWKKVDSLTFLGLPRTALTFIDSIYAKAIKEKSYAQAVKALIYRTSNQYSYEEDAQIKSLSDIETEVSKIPFPAKPVLQSILASMYWRYYQLNRYKILNRTETSGIKPDDIRTWDAAKLVDKTISLYLESLENSDSLQRTPLEVFDSVLVRANDSKVFHPTLYDFVAHRALEFFMNSETQLTKPAYQFTIREPEYFNATEKFTNLKIETKDSTSLHHKALTIFQQLIRFHLETGNVNPLVDAELMRLKFVKDNSTHELKDSLYLLALKDLENRFREDTTTARVSFEIAQHLSEQGNKYEPKMGEQYKWLKKEAVEKCDEVIKKFLSTLGADNCHALKEQILVPSLSLTVEEINVPGKPFRGLLEYKNLEKVWVKIIPTLPEDDDFEYDEQSKKWDAILKRTAVKSWEVNLPVDKDYNQHSVEIKVSSLDFGYYHVLVSTSKDFSYKTSATAITRTFISNLSYISRRGNDNSLEFYVFDRTTGSPMKGVDVQTWYEKYDHSSRRNEEIKGEKYKTDKDGYFKIPAGKDYRNFRLELKYKTDKLDTKDKHYSYRKQDEVSREWTTKTFFFLDRSIYRPGQILYFKGLVLETDGEANQIKPGYSTKVELLDVNYQKVSDVKLTANDYGTFNGTFALPSGLLNGMFSIRTETGTKTFSVEDYKRPKFEVKFNPVTGSFRLNDSVTIQGEAKAYAGSNIDHAKVQYRVVREATFPFWGWYYYKSIYPTSPSMEITNGIAETDALGKFQISFKAVPDLSLSKNQNPVFRYTVYADITDMNGETQSSETVASVGYVALQAEMEISETVDNTSNQKLKISTKNLNGEFEAAKGNISIYKLKEPDRLLRNRLWSNPDKFMMSKEEFAKDFPFDVYDDEDRFETWEKEKKVADISFDSEKEKELVLQNLSGWEPGKYVFELNTKDKFGTAVESKKFITIYRAGSNKIPFKIFSWFHPVKETAEQGESAKFILGSSAKDVKVLYEVFFKEQVLKKEWLTLNNESKTLEIPILESYRGNIAVSLTYVKEGRNYTYTQIVSVPFTNKELKIETETFRDKLKPGQQEEWKVKISGPDGEKVAAEMLAGMYDASLDAFAVNTWNFSLYNSNYYYNLQWQGNYTFRTHNSFLLSNDWASPKYNFRQQEYDRLNWFNLGFFETRMYYNYRNGARAYGGDIDMMMAPMEGKVAMKSLAVADESDAEGQEVTVVNDGLTAQTGVKESSEKDKIKSSDIVPRTNLQETAFFFPDLKTDADGKIIFSFTVPEALTRWKFMSFAHTKDLKLGFLNKETVTQKELMVLPNPPRFFRENDEIVFTAKVSNLAEKTLVGKARLMLFDALTMKPVDEKFQNQNAEISFKALQGQSAALKWQLKIPEGIQAVVYRVVASAENFSDGEESALPVLTNRMLVTETLPLNVRSNQTKTFTLDKLVNSGKSKTLKNHKLTLEITSNPAWYAIQALPYLMEYPYDCSEQIFNRYYANSIASNIANSTPRIKQVFEQWKNTDALVSNLEKNQELKSVLLEETPWVLDAQDETERKKRVALLFDLNKMAGEQRTALKKLIENQSPNGGFPWFKGMPDNRYITQYIVTGLGRLQNMKVISLKENIVVKNMVANAVRYLDDRIREDYENLKKYKMDLEKDNLGYTQIQYLYARAFFLDIPIGEQQNEAVKYYEQQAKKFWLQKSKYMQGMIALALKKTGEKEIPMNIIRSLKETALQHDELGMYWAGNSSGYYWYQAPIETQALMIEAFKEVANDLKSVDEMRIWLLKQKQTQDWKTTKATADACYALLLEGTGWLGATEITQVKVGSQEINPNNFEGTKVEAGTGYFKTSWSGDKIKPEMGKVTVTNPGKVITWGALYWQYFEQLDKITPHETPLKLNKKLFLQQPSATGPKISPVDSKTKLQPGDLLVVRIELRTDRDMEFVHMKDMRASGFEPVSVLSGYKWQDGLGYYESTRDAATNFFFDWLPKGTYVFEYKLRVAHAGDFSNGVTSIQCMYAPEFASHSEGVRVRIVQ